VHHACDALYQPAHAVLQHLLHHLRAIAHGMGWAHVGNRECLIGPAVHCMVCFAPLHPNSIHGCGT
jgi:hypothetical protein